MRWRSIWSKKSEGRDDYMAKMNSSYREFADKIELTNAKKKEIRASRDSIRGKVKQWMADNEKGSVKFHHRVHLP